LFGLHFCGVFSGVSGDPFGWGLDSITSSPKGVEKGYKSPGSVDRSASKIREIKVLLNWLK
jgi:hypothetical protein